MVFLALRLRTRDADIMNHESHRAGAVVRDARNWVQAWVKRG